MNDMFLLVKPVKPATLSGQSFSFDKFLGDQFKIYKQVSTFFLCFELKYLIIINLLISIV